MAFKGSKLKYGHRNHIFDVAFFKKIAKEKGINFTYKEARKVIDKANEVVADVVTDEKDGFKLPFGLGYIVAHKFISQKLAKDWKASAKAGFDIFYTNLHTLGYSVRVNWFSFVKESNKSYSFRSVYMFKTSEYLSKKVSKAFANGKEYMEWTSADFVDKGRLEKYYRSKIANNKNIE
jgi:hypothetical protein